MILPGIGISSGTRFGGSGAQGAHQCPDAGATDILAGGEQTAYQVASRMAWNIDCARWEDFPIPQKWFATGEALAHLLHLERTEDQGKRRKGRHSSRCSRAREGCDVS